jgi:Carboxypeptidase regulatory-like domain/TonB dependent receptor
MSGASVHTTRKDHYMKHRAVIVAAFLMAALPVLLFGQAQTTGRITGRVVDDGGQPVAGAEVSARSTERQFERSATTSANGEFTIPLLPIGPYVVTVVSPGKQPEVYNVRVGVGESSALDVRLAAGDVVSEAITVTATATALETTTGGQNISVSEQIEDLPMLDRTIEDIAMLAPNMYDSPTPGAIAIAGAPSYDTTILLDGAEISDPYFGSAPVVYLEDALEEVQVLTSGISARYGRFQGGLVNAITKSGTNNFDGTLRVELEKETWNSQTPFGEPQSDNLNKVYQGTFGGPILKDRLWFFLGARTVPPFENATTARYTLEPIVSTREEDRWQIKLSAALSPSHMIDLNHLNYDAVTTNYRGLTAGDALAQGTRQDPRTTQSLNYNGVLGPSTFVEVQLTKKDVSIYSGGDPAKGDPILNNADSSVFNNHWWDGTDPSTRNNRTASFGATHMLNTSAFGVHTLEGGIQYVLSTTGGENRQSATGYNLVLTNTNRDSFAGVVNGASTFNLLTQQAQRWLALPVGGEQELANTAVYLQDSIAWNRLRVDLGVRYDQYDGTGPAEFGLDFSGFAPRLGLTYNVTPTWQVQGTYGRYISRFNDRTGGNLTGVGAAPRAVALYTGPNLRGITASAIPAILRDNSNWLTLAWLNDPAQPTVFPASDLEAPHSDEYTLSLRHGLPRNTGSFTLTYVNREYHDFIEDFVGGICDYGIDYGRPCSNTTTVNAGTPNQVTVDTRLYANDSRAKREYQALTAVFDYRPTTRFQIAGNYTLGETTANFEGEGRNTPSSPTILGDYPRSINVDAAVPYGIADDDLRHRANVLTSYRFDMARLGQLALGSVVRYQSGFVYSRTGLVPLRPDAGYASESGSYVHYFGRNGELDKHERGALRFNDWWSFDVSARYELPILRRFSPFVKIAVENALDNDTLISFNTAGVAVRDTAGNITAWAPSSVAASQLQPGQVNCGVNDAPSKNCAAYGRIRDQLDYQTPRTFQLGVGISF